MRQIQSHGRWGRAAHVLVTGLAVGGLSACDKLLEVELPHLLTEDAIATAGSAELQVSSALALFECGYTGFGLMALGHEDVMSGLVGVGNGNNVYTATSSTGTCDGSDTSIAWLDQITGAIGMLTTAPARLVPTAVGSVTSKFPAGRGVYDRIQDEWGVANVPGGERLSAIAAMYVAMAVAHLGEFTCEAAIGASDLLTPDQVLAVAEDWITNRALGHVTAAGSTFNTMPFGITTSATASTGGTPTEMALAIRARIRWARGDLAGADVDAAAVLGTRSRFTAWITRDVGTTRRNKIWFTNTFLGNSGMMRLNQNWNGPTRLPNPATGTTWPAILPFTGYVFLGITPDGRTLEANDIPVRFAQEARNAGAAIPCAATSPQPGCPIGAVQDTRVTHGQRAVQAHTVEVPFRYGTLAAGAEGVDIPYMTWEELSLIRAERANTSGNQAGAIAFVNTIRAAPSNPLAFNTAMAALPSISGAYLTSLTDGVNDQAEVRSMIIEERRREFFSEAGRYWSTKIQNTDLTWFPRQQGSGLVYVYQGGVRLLFAGAEYTTNPYFEARGRESARGTGCANMGPLPGSQVPIF